MRHYLSFNEPGFLFGLTVTLQVHRGLKRKQSNMNIDPKKKAKIILNAQEQIELTFKTNALQFANYSCDIHLLYICW